MNYHPLTRSLRAALMDRNVCQVRALLATHGLVAFCNALSGCSPRVIADVLSLLNDSSREAWLCKPWLQPFACTSFGVPACTAERPS